MNFTHKANGDFTQCEICCALHHCRWPAGLIVQAPHLQQRPTATVVDETATGAEVGDRFGKRHSVRRVLGWGEQHVADRPLPFAE